MEKKEKKKKERREREKNKATIKNIYIRKKGKEKLMNVSI